MLDCFMKGFFLNIVLLMMCDDGLLVIFDWFCFRGYCDDILLWGCLGVFYGCGCYGGLLGVVFVYRVLWLVWVVFCFWKDWFILCIGWCWRRGFVWYFDLLWNLCFEFFVWVGCVWFWSWILGRVVMWWMWWSLCFRILWRWINCGCGCNIRLDYFLCMVFLMKVLGVKCEWDV